MGFEGLSGLIWGVSKVWGGLYGGFQSLRGVTTHLYNPHWKFMVLDKTGGFRSCSIWSELNKTEKNIVKENWLTDYHSGVCILDKQIYISLLS